MHSHRFSRRACAPDWRGGRDEARLLGRHAMQRHFGRRSRVFGQGDLRFALLKLIADKPRHGYELIKEIEDQLGGAYSPSPGVVYPTLTHLEELGYIRPVEADGARKAYEITDEGGKVLAANKAIVEAIFRRVSEAAERIAMVPPHQIVRAMENLRLALRLRLERGKLSEDQIADVAAALDAAAQTLDRD